MKPGTRIAGMLFLASLFLAVYVAGGGCAGDSQTPSDNGGAVVVDAGADTGATGGDGGAADAAGASDSGSDAELPDGGADIGEDAGDDSGAADAGAADTGFDAGPPDAGQGCAPNCVTGQMVDVPAGVFSMGCNVAVDDQCLPDEDPYHTVDVPAFKIDKYEVTAGEYAACVQAGGCAAAGTDTGCTYGKAGLEALPINCIEWTKADIYCTWAGKRLPTEAEWEKAARGTDGRKYPWGNDSLDCNHAVHSANGCASAGMLPVGSMPAGASPYGAEDMIGNVYEWVADDYHLDYTGAPADGSSWVDSPRSTNRIIRGGSFYNTNSRGLRASKRIGITATYDPAWGVRCAKDGP